MPGALIDGHCIGVDVLPYEVEAWGVGEIWLAQEVVVNHELPRPGEPPVEVSHPLVERLRAYFGGERVSFADVPLDFSGTTPFHGAITDALRAIPYGEMVTYGELAALAGHPNAQRAAGTFCARNRFPLFVPCHRVVAADGLGSYGSLGLDYKRRLLELEGAL
jgi:methylated-DNA-[protein]-cysteine S-methyltransferase